MTLLQADEASKRLAQLRRDLRDVNRELKEHELGSAGHNQLARQSRNLSRQIQELEDHLREQA